MADFNVQRGTVRIPDSGISVEIFSGLDYSAVDTAKAYVRITGALSQGAGNEGGEYNGRTGEHGVAVVNPESLDTSIRFERYNSDAPLSVSYEIIEYIGESGGANEFIVRHNELIVFAQSGSATKTPATISGIVNPSDCVPFLNGAKTDDNGRGEFEELLATGEVFSDKVTLNRQANEQDSWHSLTLVEFTGSNWTVQRVEHTYSSNALETETVSVSDYQKTALYIQQRGNNFIRSSEAGDNIWLSDNTTLNFDKYAVGVQTSVVWMLENSAWTISEYTGTLTGTGVVAPRSDLIPITQLSELQSTSLMGVQAQISRNSEDIDHAMLAMTLEDDSNIRFYKGMAKHDLLYRAQVVEWPTTSTGSTVSNALGINWNTLQLVSGSLATQWNILQAVERSASIDWNVLQEALSSFSAEWNIKNSVEGSSSIEWNLFGKAVAELGLDWNLLQSATNTLGLDWNLLQKAETGVELKFNLLNQATQSLGLNYDIKAEVNQSFIFRWNNDGTLGRVSNALSLSWNIFEGVSATLEANWNLLQSVGASVEIRNDIAQQVTQAIELGFDIKNKAEGLLAVTWDSIAQVSGNIELSWKIELDGLILPVNQMILVEENRVMIVLDEDRTMTIN